MKTFYFRIALTALLMAEPVAGLAQHESTISGHLFGNDGKPMLAANVVLSGTVNTTSAPGALYPEDFALVRINADGSFKISTDTLGAFCLMFTGIGHKMMQVPLILERPVNLQWRRQAQCNIAHVLPRNQPAQPFVL